MRCEFPERNYEQCLNRELQQTRDIFMPSQPLEELIGIDAAFLLNPRYRRLLSPLWNPRLPFPPRGVRLGPFIWDDLQHRLDRHNFPLFKANIFLQHKVPEYLTSKRAAEYHYWNSPYFRYEIQQNQLRVLSNLESKISAKALVAYVCPGFWKYTELFRFSSNGQIVRNSNFVKPTSLTGHRSYTFNSTGTSGKAFSEPTEIPNVDFNSEIERLRRIRSRLSNSQFIKSLAEIINRTIEDSDERTRNIFADAMRYFGEYDHRLGQSFSKINSFLFITGTTWLVVY
jgi:hypothetical protein